MKKNTFVSFSIILLILPWGCKSRQRDSSEVKALGVGNGQYRGYSALEILMRERIFDKTFRLNEIWSTDQSLLGSFDGIGKDNGYKGGDVNPLGTLGFYLIFRPIAKGLSDVCNQAPGIEPQFNTKVVFQGMLKKPLNPNMAKALRTVCAWPDPKAKSDDALEQLWLSIVQYDAPRSEFETWRNYIKASPELGTKAASVAMESILMTTFLNPYFMLER